MLRIILSIVAIINASYCSAEEMSWIQVSLDGNGFEQTGTNQPFVPWGFNYDHEGDGKLLEDYWDDEWKTVEEAFQEMKVLGANVVRIHLQFGKFMDSPIQPKKASLNRLVKLLELAERTGLYLDVTGLGCYHKQDVPAWYDELSESERWQAQAVFWEAIAKTCANSPAVFCYDLMNEPVVPGGTRKRTDWLGPAFGDKHFVQFITLEQGGRERTEIARDWIHTLVTAIHKHDKRHLITVGMVPWSLDRPGLNSGFDPMKVAGDLDFIAMHIYPEQNKLEEAIQTLKGFKQVGKPLIIEEIFPLKCNVDELKQFITRSREYATGWLGFYWGTTPQQYREKPEDLPASITLGWLEFFQKNAPEFQAH
ncbi:cellulase family glycosylhydrolase [Rubinisphaera italica]|uniref:Cellulase (Glycosyl hydrolase family 5) n=1 Tax=Rubinisphaera italica TaxID=2527969 RepID=A0A5C5XF63_9PLAN|nr:cellulase family glycosylhydrolase [Rubinisphaera italica]TWT61434.1 Cellulase (glycosyl hydrolase family 5) [Rubinisphaera italica]